jgi:hypothetical protein
MTQEYEVLTNKYHVVKSFDTWHASADLMDYVSVKGQIAPNAFKATRRPPSDDKGQETPLSTLISSSPADSKAIDVPIRIRKVLYCVQGRRKGARLPALLNPI